MYDMKKDQRKHKEDKKKLNNSFLLSLTNVRKGLQ